ncbi:MAG: glycosyltransferase family 39 protein, partial [Deltaproteobacteria bacterium]|nr:glycosyltransferase family 39 protein [Deltaproteobacteria bacterium]
MPSSRDPVSPPPPYSPRPAGPRWEIWAVVGLLAVAACIRALYLTAPALDSDNAMVGLMGLQMQQGEFTAFWWGSPYGGTLESSLAAGLMAFGGVNRVALSTAPALFSLVFLLGLYFLAREIYGRRTALFTLGLAALGPFHLAWTSVIARGIYLPLLALGAWFLWLAVRLARGRVAAGHLVTAQAVLGVLAGLAFWTHPLAIYFLAPALLVLWRRNLRWPLTAGFWALAAGFLLGSLPFWLYNLAHDWATFRFLLRPKPSDPLGNTLAFLAEQALPVLTGVRGYDLRDWLAPGLGPVVLALSLAAVAWCLGEWGWNLFRRARRGREGDGSEILLLCLGLMTSLFVVAGWSAFNSLRYLLPVYLFLPLTLARGLDRLAAWGRWGWAVAGAGGLAVAVLYLWGTLFYSPLYNQTLAHNHAEELKEARALGEVMDQEGLSHAWVLAFSQSMRLTFDCQENQVFVWALNAKYPPYLRQLYRSFRPGVYLLPGQLAAMEENLAALGATWRVSTPWGHLVHGIQPPPYEPRLLAAGPARITASHQPGLAPALDDLNAGSRWSPRTSQAPGQEVILDLGRDTVGVCQLLLFAGTHRELPGILALAARPEHGPWQELGRVHNMYVGWQWAAGRLSALFASPWQEYRFPPRTARYLRVRLANQARQSWSVVEALVGVEGGAKPRPRQAAGWLAGLLPGQAPVWCGPALEAWLPSRLRVSLPPELSRPEWLAGHLAANLVLPPHQTLHLAVASGLAPAAEKTLAAAGYQAERQDRHGFSYFRAVPPPPPGDSRLATVTGQATVGGLVFELDRAYRPSRLVLTHHPEEQIFPAGLVVETSDGEGAWQPAAFTARWPSRLYWAGVLPLLARADRLSLEMEPRPVRRIRLRPAPGGAALPPELRLELWGRGRVAAAGGRVAAAGVAGRGRLPPARERVRSRSW